MFSKRSLCLQSALKPEPWVVCGLDFRVRGDGMWAGLRPGVMLCYEVGGGPMSLGPFHR